MDILYNSKEDFSKLHLSSLLSKQEGPVEQPFFRFSDLPVELRLVIWDLLGRNDNMAELKFVDYGGPCYLIRHV
jgi:hypothetical protein